MGIMVITLMGTYGLCFIGRSLESKEKKISAGYFILLASVILILVSGLRENIGDTYVYKSGFEQFKGQTFFEALEGKGDVGFYVLTFFLYKISENPQFMIFITALLTQVLYMKFFLKYRTYLELQVYVYIASGFYFVSMNGLRQSLAAGIVVLGTKYMIDGQKLKFFGVTLLAMLIHQSAFIMFFIYFICRMKPCSKKLLLMICLSVVGTILFYELLPILEGVLKGTNYEHYIAVFMEGTEEGANVIRLLVSMVPVVLAFLNKNNMEDTMFNRVFTNMAMINCIFTLFSMQTWIFARFNIYFNLFNCIFIPYIISNWKCRRERKFIYAGVLIFYLLFFLREQMFAERIIF